MKQLVVFSLNAFSLSIEEIDAKLISILTLIPAKIRSFSAKDQSLIVKDISDFVTYYIQTKQLSEKIEAVALSRGAEGISLLIPALVRLKEEYEGEEYEAAVTGLLNSLVSIASRAKDKTTFASVVRVFEEVSPIIEGDFIDVILSLIHTKATEMFQKSYEAVYMLVYLSVIIMKRVEAKKTVVSSMLVDLLKSQIGTTDQTVLKLVLAVLSGPDGQIVEDFTDPILLKYLEKPDLLAKDQTLQKICMLAVNKKGNKERKDILAKIVTLRINEIFDSSQATEKILTMMVWKLVNEETKILPEILNLAVPRLKTLLTKLKEANK